MKGAQVGATEAGNCWVGYIMDAAPGPALMVMPTDDTIKRNVTIRINPMLEATPRLREKVAAPKSRDSGNNLQQKSFAGGVLMMTGANSASGLRSMPVRYLFLDEIDAYPVDLEGEGNPIDLAKARTRTFAKRKIFMPSTPTIDGASAIQREYSSTDQQKWFVPCPHCGVPQHLDWDRIKWDIGNPESVRYICLHCGEGIDERFKTQMLRAGEWVATAPENASPLKCGFHLNALYSPLGWYSWADAVRDYEKAFINEKSREGQKVFTNTVLGQCWVEEGEAPEWERIYDKREDYKTGTVPDEVCFLTAGADVQKDRIEVEVVGWCPGKRSYSIEYRVLPGDTSAQAVWDDLAAIVESTWKRSNGMELPLKLMAVDSGYNTSDVYRFTRRYDFTRVIPVKGQDSLPVIIGQARPLDVAKSGKRIGKMKVWHIGVSMLKSELYGWLRQNITEETPNPMGYCHFPREYQEHYFRGLTAEKLEYKMDKGYRKYVWVKKFDRNEPLDCRVYARAAAAQVGLDRLTDDQLKGMQQHAVRKAGDPAKAKTKKRKGSGFWG
jgi:phage terminase large subunit GpA-like protein